MLPMCMYVSLMLALLLLVIIGPITKLATMETRFLETYIDPSKIPVPTMTLCKAGARKNRLKMYKHFFALNENQTLLDIIPQFYEFRNYYVAGDLRHGPTLQYSEPLWEPKVNTEVVQVDLV